MVAKRWESGWGGTNPPSLKRRGLGSYIARFQRRLDVPVPLCPFDLQWTVTPDILMQYAPDPFLDEDKMFKTMVQGSDFDLVVLGMGDWPASSTIQPKGLWPLKRYKAHVDKVIAALAAFVGRTRARVVWHTIPAFGIADFDAWRNNRRFELYNEYAVERARGAGLEVIDLYAMSLPMTHAAHDGGHFTTFVADLWADVLIYQLCSRGQTLKR